jgi:hypothetical protein
MRGERIRELGASVTRSDEISPLGKIISGKVTIN